MDAAQPVCVTDSYRSYAEHVVRHPIYAWRQANAATYGRVHPSWADVGGSRPEPRHREYVGSPGTPQGPPTR